MKNQGKKPIQEEVQEAEIQQEEEIQEVDVRQNEAVEEKQGAVSLVIQDKSSGVETRHVLCEGKEVVVGASNECDVLVFDPYISGRHFSVKLENGKVEIIDLGSTNGLFLKLEGPAEFKEGHLLLAGKTTFKIEGSSDTDECS